MLFYFSTKFVSVWFVSGEKELTKFINFIKIYKIKSLEIGVICENCGVKDATSILKLSRENKMKYLCGACYKKLKDEEEITGLANKVSDAISAELSCPSCGLVLKEFNETKLFGCENCYKIFIGNVKETLKNFKNQRYTGKKPNVFYIRQEIKNLEQMIEICLKNGDFQKATKYGKELEQLKADNYDKL